MYLWQGGYTKALLLSVVFGYASQLPLLLFEITRSLLALDRPLLTMFDEHIQSKFLRRLARFSCSVVRVPRRSLQHATLHSD